MYIISDQIVTLMISFLKYLILDLILVVSEQYSSSISLFHTMSFSEYLWQWKNIFYEGIYVNM